MSSDEYRYSRKPVAWPRMQVQPAQAAQADAANPAQAPAAVLLGVQWLNPLMRRSYPTQWSLLWAQGLAEPNTDDNEAARFKVGDSVGEVVTSVAPWPRNKPLPAIPRSKYQDYWPGLRDLLEGPLHTFNSYPIDPNYFYSIRMGTDRPDYMDSVVFFGMPREWIGTPTDITNDNQSSGDKSMLSEQAAMGVPAPSILAYDAAHAEERMRDYWYRLHKDREGKTVRGTRATQEMIIGEPTLSLLATRRLVFDVVAEEAQAKDMMFNPTGKLPTVVVKAGDETVGFYDLQEALKFLAENPTKLVWVWNADAPHYPLGGQTNENTALLILGHPSADWGYTPLASIYTPHQHKGAIDAKSANPGGAWSGLMEAVQAQAPQDHPVERIYHDVHKHTDNINRLLGPLRSAIHQQWPDLDQIGNVYSVSEHMDGPARAASFAVNTAFAAAYANQSGKSAVVTSVADATDSWAVLIGPPPGWQPKPPVSYWMRARGEGRAYWPWFGQPTSGK
nr:hypothetical protein [Ralstonia sp. UBA689]